MHHWKMGPVVCSKLRKIIKWLIYDLEVIIAIWIVWHLIIYKITNLRWICGTLHIQLFYNDSKMNINKFLIWYNWT